MRIIRSNICSMFGRRGQSSFVLFLFASCSALRTNYEEAVPDPDYFDTNFEYIDFANEPYAHQMVLNGRLPMTNAQKVWCSKYWEYLLSEASGNLRKADGIDSMLILAAVDAMPTLSSAVLFDNHTWATTFLPKLRGAQTLVQSPRNPEEAHMHELLGRLEFQFMTDMNEPQVMTYLGMANQKSVDYSKGSQQKEVSLLNTMVMHSIDQSGARAKTDARSITVAKFFEKVSLLGISKQEWSLQDTIEKYGDLDVKLSLSSVTPMEAFQLTGEEKGGPVYVLMEGNGRINAIKMALDKVRLNDPGFMAPNIMVNAYNFIGPELARKNRNFFLDLNWRNQFPKLEIEGWRSRVPDSVRAVPPEVEAEVKNRPRYFGYEPSVNGLYRGP